MISILLPTVRPALVLRALASIPAACGDVPYEVIVVADFPRLPEVADLPVRWIERERRGVIDAMAVAAAAAIGEYWFAFNDESVLEPGALQALAREASHLEILSPRHLPPFPFQYYGRPFAPFPFVAADLVTVLGGLLDPVYKAFYADPDLGMRADAKGIPIRVVDDAIIHHDNNHDAIHYAHVAAYLAADRATFRSRWDHLGAFEDP